MREKAALRIIYEFLAYTNGPMKYHEIRNIER